MFGVQKLHTSSPSISNVEHVGRNEQRMRLHLIYPKPNLDWGNGGEHFSLRGTLFTKGDTFH